MGTVVDMTDYSTLTITATSSRGGNAFTAITIDTIVYTSMGNVKGKQNPNGTFDIDISTLTGNHTIYLCCWGSTGQRTITLTARSLS